MKSGFWTENGQVYCEATGRFIEEPAPLFDHATDVLIQCGEAASAREYLDAVAAKSLRFASFMTLLVLDTRLFTPEECAYVMKRVVEHGTSRFLKQLFDHAGDGSLKAWLPEEMARVPLEIA